MSESMLEFQQRWSKQSEHVGKGNGRVLRLVCITIAMNHPFSKRNRGIGLVLGVLFGIPMDNVGLGIALGLALGAGAGECASKRNDSNEG